MLTLCKKEKPRFTCLVGFIHKNYYNLETKYYWQKVPRFRAGSICTLCKRALWSSTQMGMRERIHPSISCSLSQSFLMAAKIINRFCNTMYKVQEKCYPNRNSESYWSHTICINTQDLKREAIKLIFFKIKENKEVIYEQHTWAFHTCCFIIYSSFSPNELASPDAGLEKWDFKSICNTFLSFSSTLCTACRSSPLQSAATPEVSC